MPTPAAQLVKVAEIAEVLATVPGTVYNLVNERRLPHLHRGRSLLFDTAEVLQWIRDGGADILGLVKCLVCENRKPHSA